METVIGREEDCATLLGVSVYLGSFTKIWDINEGKLGTEND